MEHAAKLPSDPRRGPAAARRHGAPGTAATHVDNRPAAVAQRELAGIVRDSFRVGGPRTTAGFAFSPRVIAQRRQFEGMFGHALPRAAAGVIQRITMKDIEKKLPKEYQAVLLEWVKARTIPTADRPEKYKDPTAALTHFLAQIESVDILKETLDRYRANKKADEERDEDVLRMLPQFAVKSIASFKLLKESGASISEDALTKALRFLKDDEFFKAHVATSVQKMKQYDPYEVKVVVGTRLNEETTAFAEKGVAYFKSSVDYSTVIHETLHLICRTPVKFLLGSLLNEGITELLTEWTVADEGGKYTAYYEAEKTLTKAAFMAVGKLQKSFLARTYFSDPKEMASLLETKIGKDKFEKFKSATDADAALALLKS
jgi:hypothetical protein